MVLFTPILYIFLIKYGYSYTEAGIYLSVFWGVSAITELPTGILADTIGQKMTVVLSCLLRGIGLGMLLVDHFFFLLLSAVLTGVAESMMSGTLSSWLMNQVKDKEILNLDHIFSRANLYGTCCSLIIGFLIAQYVFEYNKILPILMSAIYFLILSGVVLKYLPEKHRQPQHQDHAFLNFRHSWKANIRKIWELLMTKKIIFLVIILLSWPEVLDIGPSNQWQVAFSGETKETILGYMWVMISVVGMLMNLAVIYIVKLKKHM
ncbi:hypothetical protein B5C01_05260 [Staphylococcus delphini]|uniref:Major facilitator superfamily permease n=1 Tax=Staphylococcus delphini TaxID=53344 RepID=A0A2A4GZ89_9STAP|nr:MFS transporter [Staphylococcus delphini]PCF56159.1 hypothetical protein B5C08_04330 [Staphylococcus delphini]PCF62396.1 hypothetical protein B5C01_05260 [Staphylococcus delphini]HEC2158385.1 MFS transporter [Staphylococcus delphini]